MGLLMLKALVVTQMQILVVDLTPHLFFVSQGRGGTAWVADALEYPSSGSTPVAHAIPSGDSTQISN